MPIGMMGGLRHMQPPLGRGRGQMDIAISLREEGPRRWVAEATEPPVRVVETSRERCLAGVRRTLEPLVASGDGPVTVMVEVTPLLAGVAEAAEVMGWDKRRVITYIDRGRFPRPIQALASGRIWLREDVERFAEQWHARQLERRRRRAGLAPGRSSEPEGLR